MNTLNGPELEGDATRTDAAIVRARLARNYHRDITPEERKQITEQELVAACKGQKDLLALAIATQEIFERWAADLLTKFYQRVLAGSTRPATLEFDDDITLGRSSDIYGERGPKKEQPPKSARGPLSRRAEYLEVLVCRYFALQPTGRRGVAIRSFRQSLGIPDGAAADSIEERLLALVQCELSARKRAKETKKGGIKGQPADEWGMDVNWWSIAGLARSFFDALSWKYISMVERFVTKDDPLGSAVRNYVTTINRNLDAVITINKPAQVSAARSAFRPQQGHDLDDLLGTAMEATLEVAQRFHPTYGRGGFIKYAQTTIARALRRHNNKARAIAIPEKNLSVLGKFNVWRARNIILAETLPLEEQVKRAELGVTAEKLKEYISAEASAHTVSVEALQASMDSGSDNNELASAMFTDRGAAAEEIRESVGGDRRLALLRGAFEKLPPLHQALLTCLHPCNVTEGGEVAWFDYFEKLSNDLVGAAVSRIRTGVASSAHLAVAINTRY